jgi:hypothetical protein
MKKYKLIKKLPFENSPEIGYISEPHSTQKDNAHYWNHNWFHPKDFPEFWEEVVEKDYEILSFKQNSRIEDLWEAVDITNEKFARKSGQMFCTSPYTLEEILNNPLYSIHSVKRLSDGEIFTIGDKITGFTYNEPREIKGFTISQHILNINQSEGRTELEYAKKVKKPLFTTEDGVDIYERDLVTPVNLDTLKIHATTPINTGESLKYGNYKYFSTEEKAEEYVLMNKPLNISIKELCPIIGQCNNTTYIDLDLLTKKLKKLIY